MGGSGRKEASGEEENNQCRGMFVHLLFRDPPLLILQVCGLEHVLHLNILVTGPGQSEFSTPLSPMLGSELGNWASQNPLMVFLGSRRMSLLLSSGRASDEYDSRLSVTGFASIGVPA